MRILYANVIEQHRGWGAEWFMDRALRALGHDTRCIDYREHRHDLVRQLRGVPEFDAFLLQRGESFPLPLISAIDRPRLFWASELVARRRDQDRLLSSGLFDHVFFRTPACIDETVRRGWRDREHCSLLLSAFDPEWHRPLGLPKDIDVLFVGALTARRRQWLAQLERRRHITVAREFGEELVRLVNRARIVLNIHAEDYLDTETRVFEVLGSRAMLLTEPLSQENPFSPTHLHVARTVDEMAESIDYFLANEDAREAMAERGYRAAIAEHTCQHRAQQIVDTMKGIRYDSTRPAVHRGWRIGVHRLTEVVARTARGIMRRRTSVV